MDDVTHDSPSLGQISRKRKADGDDPASQDCQSPEPMAVDPIDGLLPIPRHHQWSGSSDGHISTPFLEESNHPTPTCRSREPKRPKLQVSTTSATGSPPQQRRKGMPCSPQRRGGRSGDSPHGYIESITRSDSPKSRRHQKASALSTIDLDSPHIPSFLPIPNRDTLKELDLEAVLCNPQLRKSHRFFSNGLAKSLSSHSPPVHSETQHPRLGHDLLFDSGLQFRPTSSRRKRDQAELYWAAVTRELECRCTCITWDGLGRIMAEPVCICRDIHSPPTHATALILPNFRGKTLRTASRIRHLFSELLEVLLSVIQPLPPSILNSTVRPTSFQPALDKLTTQANYIRSILDPELIQQEIYHGVWDASGLFQVLGETLKCHCAPMRDRNVEAMIQTAQSCVDGRNATSLAKAIRMCFDVLEFMKLVIVYISRLHAFLIPMSIFAIVGHRKPPTAKPPPLPFAFRARLRTKNVPRQEKTGEHGSCHHKVMDPESFYPAVYRHATQHRQPTSIGAHLPFSPPIRPDQYHRHQGHHQPHLQPKAPFFVRHSLVRIRSIEH